MNKKLLHKAIKIYEKEGTSTLLKMFLTYARGKFKIGSDKKFNMYNRLREIKQSLRYKAPASPKKIIYVDPKNINYYTRALNRSHGLGQISSGRWDLERNCKRLIENSAYKGIKQRFEKDYSWEETEYYLDAKRRFNKGNAQWGYENIEEFKNIRCEFLDELYTTIKNEGYKPNYIREHDAPLESSTKNTIHRHIHCLEPFINIARDGRIYWREGFHRISMSKVLKLDKIPVHVLGRHQKWQILRDKMHESKETRVEYNEHPDAQDIILNQCTFGNI